MRTYDLRVYIGSGTSRFEVKDIKNITIKRSSDLKNSKAEVTLKNANLRHINTLSSDEIQLNNIEMDDNVEIYAGYAIIPDVTSMTSAEKEEYLLFNGTITELGLNNDSKKTEIKFIATDAMLTLMNKVRIANYNNTSLTDVLINLVQQAFGPGYTNYEIPAGLPNITYYSTHKPLHEHIQRVSTTDYTQFSRNAVFKLVPDPTNATYPYKFIWFNPTDKAETTLNGAITSGSTSIVLTDASSFPTEGAISIGSEVIRYTSKSSNTLTVSENGRGFGGTTAAAHADGVDVSSATNITIGKSGPGINRATSVKAKKSEEDAVNMIIMRLGRDLLNRTITHYAYDVHSETKGLRMKIVDWKWVSTNFYEQNVGAKTQVATTLSNPSYPATLVLNDASSLATGTNYLKLLVEDNPEIIEVTYSGSGNSVTISSAGDRGQFNTAPSTNIEAGTVVADWTDIVALGNTTIRTNIKAEGRNTYAED